MIELRWIEREIIIKNFGPVKHKILQYRNLLTDNQKLGIQSQLDAEIAAKYEQWKDVPYSENRD